MNKCHFYTIGLLLYIMGHRSVGLLSICAYTRLTDGQTDRQTVRLSVCPSVILDNNSFKYCWIECVVLYFRIILFLRICNVQSRQKIEYHIRYWRNQRGVLAFGSLESPNDFFIETCMSRCQYPCMQTCVRALKNAENCKT